MAAAPARGRGAWLGALVRVWMHLPAALRLVAAALCMGFLWWSSSQVPTPRESTVLDSFVHNGMHIVAYAGLGAAVWLAWSRRPVEALQPWRSRGAWLVAAGYGVVDELHQSFVPGRVASASDWLTDALGAALAIVVLRGVTGVSRRWGAAAALLASASLGAAALATFGPW